MSFGQFQVIGDYIDHDVPVPCTGTVQQNFNNVLNAIGANPTFANPQGTTGNYSFRIDNILYPDPFSPINVLAFVKNKTFTL